MPTPFRTVIREVAKRVNAISGGQSPIAESNYVAEQLTTAELDSPIYGLSFLRDIVADVHSDLVLAICSVADPVTGIGNHPWRNYFADVTGNIPHGGNLPLVGAGGKTIIGSLGRPYDAVGTDRIMTPASLQRVLSYKNFNTVYLNNPYLYAINGSKIYHTTQNIIFECCVYERADVAGLISSNGNFGGAGTVPDVLTPVLVAGGVVNAVVAGEYIEQIAPYAAYYASAREQIANGGTQIAGLPVNT